MVKIAMKNCLKSFNQLLFLAYLLNPVTGYPLAIIWDLGYTLLKPDSLMIAKVIGYNNCLRMYLKHGDLTQELMATILREALCRPGEKIDPFGPCDLSGKPMPKLMCDWFEGNLTNKQVLHEALQMAKTYRHFKSPLEKECFTKIITWMFTPKLLADSMKPIKSMVRVLKACAQDPTIQLYILSNWDPESFLEVCDLPSTKAVFKHFKRKNMYISGLIGYMKPDPRFYKYLLKEAHLDPKESIFVDDQEENICAARQCGMRAIHYKGDAEEVENQLKKWKVLPGTQLEKKKKRVGQVKAR